MYMRMDMDMNMCEYMYMYLYYFVLVLSSCSNKADGLIDIQCQLCSIPDTCHRSNEIQMKRILQLHCIAQRTLELYSQ